MYIYAPFIIIRKFLEIDDQDVHDRLEDEATYVFF